VPVGTNVGLFWPKRGILRKPGLAVVEFLPRIEPGLPMPSSWPSWSGWSNPRPTR
jgi:1-acyl-sn-glycerol-3-phosphate acyltransferase